MDKEVSNTENCKAKPSNTLNSKEEEVGVNREEDEESNSLLSSQRGEMSKRLRKSQRKVQWNDRNGNKLVEVLEFQPSDTSDTDDDEDSDSCICTIM